MTVDNERDAAASLRHALVSGVARLTPNGGLSFPRCIAHDELGAGATVISENLTLLGVPHEIVHTDFVLADGSRAPGRAPTVDWVSLPALAKWIPDLPKLIFALQFAD